MTRPTILVLDDDPEVCALLGEVLRSRLPEAHVEVRASAVTALKEFKSENVALVLADNMMPGVTGISFIKRFRNGNLHSDILMTGANPDMEDVPDESPIMVFRKPFDMNKLITFIAATLGIEAAA